MTTLPARQRDSAHWRKPRKKRKRRVNSVGLNDGDKNGERANGGKKRKRDNGRAKEKERKSVERERNEEKEKEREGAEGERAVSFANVN